MNRFQISPEERVLPPYLQMARLLPFVRRSRRRFPCHAADATPRIRFEALELRSNSTVPAAAPMAKIADDGQTYRYVTTALESRE